MSVHPEILVIMGSVRRNRICPEISAWVAALGRDAMSADIEVVDLRDWALPMDQEPGIPALGDYISEETKAWSEKVGRADAFVFVTPQYNWGYPAALKNAIDHLYQEWRGKPAMIVTYGGHGGGKCAAQLQQVLNGLSMRVVPVMPGLVLERAVIQANAGGIDAAVAFSAQASDMRRAFNELANLL